TGRDCCFGTRDVYDGVVECAMRTRILWRLTDARIADFAYVRHKRTERINRRRWCQHSPRTPSSPPATVAGSGTIVPSTRIWSTMFCTLLPFECPPVSSIRRTRFGALLAAVGTAALSTTVPMRGTSWVLNNVKLAPPLVLK